MAKASSFMYNGYLCHRLTDKKAGRNLRYSIKIDKYTANQWIQAHEAIIDAIPLSERKNATGKQMRELCERWLAMNRSERAASVANGIDLSDMENPIEASLKNVFIAYLNDFCRPEENSATSITNTKRQCSFIMRFLENCKITYYSQLNRDIVKSYPSWRNAKGAGTTNKELQRFAAVIRYGVKYHKWPELYLLDGIRVRHTQENTKSVRPFEIPEVKAILAWLAANAEKTGNWYLHDMALLSVCSGMEAKALSLLAPEWVKKDLGILRVFDKLVSGVLDAKTQNRARDIPLTQTMIRIFDRGYVFSRPHKFAGVHTPIHSYSRKAFAKCEVETGIKDVDWHRFRHTCATARLSSGWQLVRVSRMLGHSSINTTAQHYAEYDLSASPAGFEGMIAVYKEFVEWLDSGYFA